MIRTLEALEKVKENKSGYQDRKRCWNCKLFFLVPSGALYAVMLGNGFNLRCHGVGMSNVDVCSSCVLCRSSLSYLFTLESVELNPLPVG